MDRARHLLSVRVYYEDTDFSGVVYHANYLRFLERGRTELLRNAGIDQSRLHEGGTGLNFAVRRMALDYLKPARMDDLLTIETWIGDVRGASLGIGQRITKDDAVLLTADVDVATVSNGRPARLPAALRDRLRAALGPTT